MYVTNLSSVRANIFKPRVTEHIPSRSLSILFNLYDACSIITTQPCHFQELYRSYAQHFKMYASLLLSKLRKTGWGKKNTMRKTSDFFGCTAILRKTTSALARGEGHCFFTDVPGSHFHPILVKL